MTSIIAYTWDADIYCPDCTRDAYRDEQLTPDESSPDLGWFDEHNLPDLIDREGNSVHPVFSTDEPELAYCGYCMERL